jgi:hypothetical protein
MTRRLEGSRARGQGRSHHRIRTRPGAQPRNRLTEEGADIIAIDVCADIDTVA